MGTIGYIAPEQLRGGAVDGRTDLFALGCVLYEMLTGRRAFGRDTAVETLAAILKEPAPEPSIAAPEIPEELDRITARCMAKEPAERFQSASDLAFDLHTSFSAPGRSRPRAADRARRPGAPGRWALLAGLILTAAAALAVGLAWWQARSTPAPDLSFQRLTFRRGWVGAARFLPDGSTVVYSAGWNGEPEEPFSVRLDGPESRTLGYPGAGLLAVPPSSELALMLDLDLAGFWPKGTLALAPFSGGSPRAVEENVLFADWSPAGDDLALVRGTRAGQQLEFPPGRVLVRSAGNLSHPRVSHDGSLVAYLDHPLGTDNGGSVLLADRSGATTTLAGPFSAVEGLAWSPDGDEVWFTAMEGPPMTSRLHAVTPGGRKRLMLSQPQWMRLQDVAPDGRILLACDSWRQRMFHRGPGDAVERELSWLDGSMINDLSADGRHLLFNENYDGTGGATWIYLRESGGSPPVKLYAGSAGFANFSPDGRFVLIAQAEPPGILVSPIGPGQPQTLPLEGFTVQWAGMLPDGERLWFSGSEGEGPARIWLTDRKGSKPRPASPERTGGVVSPDGTLVLARLEKGLGLYPLDGGDPVPVRGWEPADEFAGWGADDSLFVWRSYESPIRVYRLEPRAGARTLLWEITPVDRAGYRGGVLKVAPDGRSYAFSPWQTLSELYVVTGLK